MPMNDEEAFAAADAQDAEAQAGVVNDVGGSAPMASEPLDPAALNLLADVVTQTAESLAGGQAQIPPIAPVEEATEQVPSDLYTLVSVMQGFVAENPEAGAGFDIDEMVTSNAGLKELAGIIGEIGGSEGAQKAAQQPSPTKGAAPPPAAAPSAPPKRDMSRLVPGS